MSRENRHGQGLMSHPASDNPPPESAALLKVLLLLDPTEQPSAFSCLLVVQGRIVPDEQRNIAGGFLAMYIPNSRETGSFHFKTREGGHNYVRVDFGLSWMLCIRTPGGERGEERRGASCLWGVHPIPFSLLSRFPWFPFSSSFSYKIAPRGSGAPKQTSLQAPRKRQPTHSAHCTT